MNQLDLSNQRSEILTQLSSLLIHVGDEYRAKNETELEEVRRTFPPIEHSLWRRASFLCGIFGLFMWDKLQDATERDALWSCLLWSVSYEQHFQRRFTSQRLRSLLNVFSTPLATDEGWVEAAWAQLEHLVPVLERPGLATLKRFLAGLEAKPQPTKLLNAIDDRLTALPKDLTRPKAKAPSTPKPSEGIDPEDALVFPAFEKTWDFLDKSKERSNREEVSRASEDPTEIGRLEFLARIVAKNVIWRLTHSSAEASNDQLESAILLAGFATRYAIGKAAAEARRCQLLLRGLLGMRHHSLDPESFASELEGLSEGLSEGISGGKRQLEMETWTDLAGLVTRHLSDRRINLDYPDKVEADAWVRVFAARTDKIDALAREGLVAECEEHGVASSLSLEILKHGKVTRIGDEPGASVPLAFLAADQRADFEDNVRNGRLNEVRASLKGGRKALFSLLSRALADESYRHLQCPRRPLRPRKNPRLFENARKLVDSDLRDDRRKALSILEAIERDTGHPDYKRLAAEWVLFARARALGPVRVVKQWEDHRKGQPSWEEIWNLAVFYLQTSSSARALSVLEPGVHD